MSYSDNELSTVSDIVNGFSIFFKSVFKHDSSIIPNCRACDIPKFRIEYVTPEEMKSELKALNPYTSTGSDNVPSVFLLQCADELCLPCLICR